MQCFLCKESFPEFAPAGLCPHCGSKPEHRLQFLLLARTVKLKATDKILSVGASEPELRYIAQHSAPAKVTAIDLRDRTFHSVLKLPHRAMQMDVTHLAFSDHCFDLILCGGVLPFIRSDYLAISEAHRALKGEGLALMTVKMLLPKSRRASELHGEDPKTYPRAFLDQNGDEWLYGPDFFERVEAAGFFFHRLAAGAWLESSVRAEQGIPDALELILCFKFRDAKERFLKEAGLG